MADYKLNIDGAWVDVTAQLVYIDGEWYPIQATWVQNDGAWQCNWLATVPSLNMMKGFWPVKEGHGSQSAGLVGPPLEGGSPPFGWGSGGISSTLNGGETGVVHSLNAQLYDDNIVTLGQLMVAVWVYVDLWTQSLPATYLNLGNVVHFGFTEDGPVLQTPGSEIVATAPYSFLDDTEAHGTGWFLMVGQIALSAVMTKKGLRINTDLDLALSIGGAEPISTGTGSYSPGPIPIDTLTIGPCDAIVGAISIWQTDDAGNSPNPSFSEVIAFMKAIGVRRGYSPIIPPYTL